MSVAAAAPLEPRYDAVQALRDHLCAIAVRGSADDIVITVRLVEHTYLPRPASRAQRQLLHLAALQELDDAARLDESRRWQLRRARQALERALQHRTGRLAREACATSGY